MAEVLVALALWALASPLIWSLSYQGLFQAAENFKDYERQRLARSTLFWLHALPSSAARDQMQREGIEIISRAPITWSNYNQNPFGVRNKNKRELVETLKGVARPLPRAPFLDLQAFGSGGNASRRGKRAAPLRYRVVSNSYRIEQTPMQESSKAPVWRRLVCCELAVLFDREEPPLLHEGSLLGPLSSGEGALGSARLKGAAPSPRMPSASSRFSKAFYSYFTLLKRKS